MKVVGESLSASILLLFLLCGSQSPNDSAFEPSAKTFLTFTRIITKLGSLKKQTVLLQIVIWHWDSVLRFFFFFIFSLTSQSIRDPFSLIVRRREGLFPSLKLAILSSLRTYTALWPAPAHAHTHGSWLGPMAGCRQSPRAVCQGSTSQRKRYLA